VRTQRGKYQIIVTLIVLAEAVCFVAASQYVGALGGLLTHALQAG
jgi:hypothetical protein